jgi:hypothetical protein
VRRHLGDWVNAIWYFGFATWAAHGAIIGFRSGSSDVETAAMAVAAVMGANHATFYVRRAWAWVEGFPPPVGAARGGKRN